MQKKKVRYRAFNKTVFDDGSIVEPPKDENGEPQFQYDDDTFYCKCGKKFDMFGGRFDLMNHLICDEDYSLVEANEVIDKFCVK